MAHGGDFERSTFINRDNIKINDKCRPTNVKCAVQVQGCVNCKPSTITNCHQILTDIVAVGLLMNTNLSKSLSIKIPSLVIIASNAG